jgi:hypothetical protein
MAVLGASGNVGLGADRGVAGTCARMLLSRAPSRVAALERLGHVRVQVGLIERR